MLPVEQDYVVIERVKEGNRHEKEKTNFSVAAFISGNGANRRHYRISDYLYRIYIADQYESVPLGQV